MKTVFALAAVIATALIAASVAFGAGNQRGYVFITDTLGGNGSAKALPAAFKRYAASHGRPASPVQGYSFITDTLGGNGGIGSPARAGSTNFSWGAAGVGAAGSAGALLALLGGALLVVRRRTRLAT